MSLVVGFALLARDPLGQRTLRYFRIRNHLRSLGLGRQAMECLHGMADPVVRDQLMRTNFAPGRRQMLKNLFRSVLNEKARSLKDGRSR